VPGRFKGITDEQWKILEGLLPTWPKRVGRPNPDFRKVLNTILYVLITGCRWCDVPIGSQWGKRSTAHKWLGIFQSLGIWEEIQQKLLNMAEAKKLINWDKGAIDGSFSLRQRRGRRAVPWAQGQRRHHPHAN